MSARSRVLLDADIRLLVSSHIASGRLPAVVVCSALAGYGSGGMCIVCDRHIQRDETEYEVEAVSSPEVLRFHLRCHDAWQRECLEGAKRAGTPAADGASLCPR